MRDVTRHLFGVLMGELNDILLLLSEKYGTTPEIVESLYYEFLDWNQVENELKRLFK